MFKNKVVISFLSFLSILDFFLHAERKMFSIYNYNYIVDYYNYDYYYICYNNNSNCVYF